MNDQHGNMCPTYAAQARCDTCGALGELVETFHECGVRCNVSPHLWPVDLAWSCMEHERAHPNHNVHVQVQAIGEHQ